MRSHGETRQQQGQQAHEHDGHELLCEEFHLFFSGQLAGGDGLELFEVLLFVALVFGVGQAVGAQAAQEEHALEQFGQGLQQQQAEAQGTKS